MNSQHQLHMGGPEVESGKFCVPLSLTKTSLADFAMQKLPIDDLRPAGPRRLRRWHDSKRKTICNNVAHIDAKSTQNRALTPCSFVRSLSGCATLRNNQRLAENHADQCLPRKQPTMIHATGLRSFSTDQMPCLSGHDYSAAYFWTAWPAPAVKVHDLLRYRIQSMDYGGQGCPSPRGFRPAA